MFSNRIWQELLLLPYSLPLQSRMLWGALLPELDSWAREPHMGLRALIPVEKLLQYNYPHVCGSPTWVVWDLIILQVHQSVVVSSLCLWMCNIFFVDSSPFLMDGCSVFCCGFGLLVRGGELYFIILSLSSPFQTFGYIYCIFSLNLFSELYLITVKVCISLTF